MPHAVTSSCPENGTRRGGDLGAGTAVPVSTHASVIAASWAASVESSTRRGTRASSRRAPPCARSSPARAMGHRGDARRERQPWLGLGVGGRRRRGDRQRATPAVDGGEHPRRAGDEVALGRAHGHHRLGVPLGRVGIAVEQGDEAVPHRRDRRQQPAVERPLPRRGPLRGRRRSRPGRRAGVAAGPRCGAATPTPRGAAWAGGRGGRGATRRRGQPARAPRSTPAARTCALRQHLGERLVVGAVAGEGERRRRRRPCLGARDPRS